MRNVYFFSGLGADERIFQNLDLSFCNPIFIKWNLPFKNESIESYATRLLEQINDENPILIGVSFGGIMVVEVGKLIKTEKIIIISSAKTKHEIPSYYKILGKIKANKILPVSLLQKFKKVNHFIFGISSKEEKILLNKIIEDTNPIFLHWAIDKIIHWQNETILPNLIHIHGADDKILPIKFIKADYPIKSGGHFMVLQQDKLIHDFFLANIKF